MASTFGTRIKELRNKQKLTLEQLAQASGSAKCYKNPPRPSADKLSLIARTLGVTVDYLFGRDEQTLSSAEDIAFFREYTGLPDDTKEQLRQMAKILGTKKDT
jgi:transcriptional regulator with XRE-family HTH domain